MKQVIIVKTGEGYSDNEYTFEKEADAIAFFQALGKATLLTRNYISGGIGYVYTESQSQNHASVTYGNLYTDKEMQVLKDKEEADRIFAIAEKEAEEAKNKQIADELGLEVDDA